MYLPISIDPPDTVSLTFPLIHITASSIWASSRTSSGIVSLDPALFSWIFVEWHGCPMKRVGVDNIRAKRKECGRDSAWINDGRWVQENEGLFDGRKGEGWR